MLPRVVVLDGYPSGAHVVVGSHDVAPKRRFAGPGSARTFCSGFPEWPRKAQRGTKKGQSWGQRFCVFCGNLACSANSVCSVFSVAVRLLEIFPARRIFGHRGHREHGDTLTDGAYANAQSRKVARSIPPIGHEKHKEARKKGKTANRGLTPPTRLDCGIISTQVIRYLPSLPRRASWRMLARFPFTRLPSFRSINTLLDAGALVVINSIFPS